MISNHSITSYESKENLMQTVPEISDLTSHQIKSNLSDISKLEEIQKIKNLTSEDK